MTDNIIARVATAAIMHNGKRYEIGDEVELTEAEYNRISFYVEPKGTTSATSTAKNTAAKKTGKNKAATESDVTDDAQTDIPKDDVTDETNTATDGETIDKTTDGAE